MSTSPLKTKRFRLVFSIAWLQWAIIHAFALHRLGFSWEVAIIDSLISNISLLAIALLLITMLRFYLPAKNKYTYLAGLCASLSVLWLLFSRFVLQLVQPEINDYTNFFSESVPVRLAFAFLITGCMALLSMLWYTLQDQQEMDKRKSEAERLSRDAELYKLRQQLQPHFLFNSLNSINALIGSQPHQARNMIQQLSDFLRGTLRKEENQWISLDDELNHLQLYLDIEKVRFGHRLDTRVSNRVTGNMLLPAMLLQPVVENAIKFGLYDTTDDVLISIEASVDNHDLILQVRNPFDPETSSPKKGTGFGLSSVHRRLYLLFARNDLLQTEIREEQFITTIKIPQLNDSRNYHR